MFRDRQPIQSHVHQAKQLMSSARCLHSMRMAQNTAFTCTSACKIQLNANIRKPLFNQAVALDPRTWHLLPNNVRTATEEHRRQQLMQEQASYEDQQEREIISPTKHSLHLSPQKTSVHSPSDMGMSRLSLSQPANTHRMPR